MAAPGNSLRNGPAPAGPFDVAIVGAGVVGCATARELTRRGARCVLIDAARDVGTGTSKANTAILHTGFDAKPGTLEARLVARGYELLREYAAEAGIPTARTGALMVAWTREQLDGLAAIESTARENGYRGTRRVDAAELYEREPALGPGAHGALEIPDEGILCPWTTTLAFATEAVRGGCELVLDAPVEAVAGGDEFELGTPRGPIRSRYLVNTAGLHSDEIHALVGHGGEFTITPRRGQLIIFDKLARGLVNHVLLPVPTERTKGVLVCPTVYGNVLLGPTAEDLDDRDDRSTTAAGLDSLLADGARIVPGLADHEVTATFAGLRAATEHRDYQLRVHEGERYVCAGGIRSTGVSGSLGIAEHVRDGLAAAGLELSPQPHGPTPRMPNIGEASARPFERPELIAEDPEFGRVACFCERVTWGELEAAMRSEIPPVDVDGLRRRTRVLMGRCQGFFCEAEVRAILGEIDG
jgi:glycerol-3-phosphate dehydrogenase